jgi:hypothetical protein
MPKNLSPNTGNDCFARAGEPPLAPPIYQVQEFRWAGYT